MYFLDALLNVCSAGVYVSLDFLDVMEEKTYAMSMTIKLLHIVDGLLSARYPKYAAAVVVFIIYSLPVLYSSSSSWESRITQLLAHIDSYKQLIKFSIAI